MQEKNERYKKEYHAKCKQDENRKTVQKSRCPYAKNAADASLSICLMKSSWKESRKS